MVEFTLLFVPTILTILFELPIVIVLPLNNMSEFQGFVLVGKFITNIDNLQAKIEQLWHSLPTNKGQLTITPTTAVKRSTKEGQYSSKYGTKTASKTTILTSETGHIHTNISIKP
jgi:hypothetical protein